MTSMAEKVLGNQTQPSEHNEPSSLKHNGPMRAAKEIGASIQSCVGSNEKAFWADATYRELAALIDRETAASEMLAALIDLLDGLDLAKRNDDLPLPFVGYGEVFLANARAAVAKAVGDPAHDATGKTVA